MSLLAPFASMLNKGAQELARQQPAPGTFGSAMTGMNPNATAQGAFGSAMTGMGGARPSGRSWMDPQRMEERFLRLQERQARNPATRSAGGGGGAQAPTEPLPIGAQSSFGNKTVSIIPPTVTDKYTADYARRYGRGQLEAMGARFEPQVGVYDKRTGLTETLDPATAMQRGLLGSAQRALLEGLRSGQTFSRSNPFV